MNARLTKEDALKDAYTGTPLKGIQREIAESIFGLLRDDDSGLLYTGGCDPFYTPESWLDRGEDFGTDSALVVVHDGGMISDALGPYAVDDFFSERLRARLKELGYYLESCTAWYSAVYPI